LAARIRVAIEVLGKARAEETRERAAKLGRELSKHAAKTAELLAALEAHEQIRYVMALDDASGGHRAASALPRGD
jgi:hypothetical protein